MDESLVNDVLVEQRQILKELRDITKDHESRIRIIEKVIVGIMAVISFIEFLRKGL